MTNIRRPIHLQLRPASIALAPTCSPKALSPTAGDSLPSQILPHLFVGNQEQTNRDTLNRLNISYILSLGLLPLVSNSMSPTSPTTTATITTSTTPTTPTTNSNTTTTTTNNNNNTSQYVSHHVLLPSQNSSKDFKIRLRSGNNHNNNQDNSNNQTLTIRKPLDRDENKGVKAIRYIQCKCINVADNSEQSLAKFFDEAHQFIDEARRKKCNILVHCLAGISRSPTIAIAYLMRVNSLRLQDAYNLVKQCRPQIDPNLSFMGQLMIYEKSLEDRRKNLKSKDC